MDDKRMTEEYHEVIPPELHGWTKNEKYDLNLALKYFGFDIPNIKKRIPTKSEAEIIRVIEYFQSELRKTESKKKCKRKRKMKTNAVPLAKWAELITETQDYKDLQTETSTAVRILANFEKFPDPSDSGNIDFKKMYHYIADAMEGKPLPDDPIAADVFHQCIMETAMLSKLFIPENELKELLQIICKGNGHVNIPCPTEDSSLAALHDIMNQINYNPMKIPEQYLKYPQKYIDQVM